MAKNIEMQYYNGSTYEIVYPTITLTNATGILSIDKGGTGNSEGHAISADNSFYASQLDTARTFLTNLSSTSTGLFDGTQDVVSGITGILPISNGGTGTNSLDSLASTLGAGRIEVGRYEGVGKYGSSNKRSLTVGFTPKVVLIFRGGKNSNSYLYFDIPFALLYSTKSFCWKIDMTGDYPIFWSYEMTSVSLGSTTTFYHKDRADYMMNESLAYYFWIALG